MEIFVNTFVKRLDMTMTLMTIKSTDPLEDIQYVIYTMCVHVMVFLFLSLVHGPLNANAATCLRSKSRLKAPNAPKKLSFRDCDAA